MAVSGGERSTKDWEHLVGEQIRRARIDADLTQDDLAAATNLSRRTIINLETGHGATLTTLIKVVRALHLEVWLTSLAPAPDIDPLAVIRSKTSRHRASPRR